MQPSAWLSALLVLTACQISNCLLLDILDAIFVRTKHEDFYDKYLDIPGVRSRFREPLHGQVRDALAKLPIQPASSPETVLKSIEIALEGDREESRRVIYKQLAELADESNVDCPRDLLALVKSIQAQTRAERAPFQNFVGFMTRFARRKLQLCSAQINLMRQFPGEDTAAADLEKFFRAGQSVNSKANDVEMFKVLSQINLVLSKFDVLEMGRVAKEHVGAKLSPLHQQPVTLMRKFLTDKCQDLSSELSDVLDTINLARALGANQKHPAKLLKLNELYRLCLAWKKDTPFRIVDNFHAQVDSAQPVLRPKPSDGEM